jgi:hypothetical protein
VTPEPEPEAARPAALEIVRADVRSGRLEVEVGLRGPEGAALADPGGERPSLTIDGYPAGDGTPAGSASSPVFAWSVPAAPDGDEHRISVRLGELVAETRVVYPRAESLPWIWTAAPLAVALFVLGSGVLWLGRGTRSRVAVVSGSDAGRRLVLRRGRTRIGSFEQNDLVLRSPLVSRFHAEIVVRGREAELRDLHSLNGTELNGRRVELAKLAPGDKIRIGDVDLFYEG